MQSGENSMTAPESLLGWRGMMSAVCFIHAGVAFRHEYHEHVERGRRGDRRVSQSLLTEHGCVSHIHTQGGDTVCRQW